MVVNRHNYDRVNGRCQWCGVTREFARVERIRECRAVSKEEVIYAWSIASDRRAAKYEIILRADGTLSCDCAGWVFARKGKPRGCKHTTSLETEAHRIHAAYLRGERVERQDAKPDNPTWKIKAPVAVTAPHRRFIELE